MKGDEQSAFSEYVKQCAADRGWNLSRLAEEAKISRPTLHGLLTGLTGQAKISTIIALATALRVHPVLLFRHLLAEMDFEHFSTTGAKYRFDASGFIQDVTIPDNTIVLTDSVFVKTWEIQNIGSVAWRGRKLVCMDGITDWSLISAHTLNNIARSLQPSQPVIDIPDTLPNDKMLLSVEFTASSYPCTVISYWKMVDANNDICFPETQGLSCLVRVVSL